MARLARLPEIVIRIAMEQSADFETKLNNKRDKKGGDDGSSSSGVVDEKVKRRMNAYFEKLVSIVGEDSEHVDDSQLDALVYNATELWRRYKSEF